MSATVPSGSSGRATIGDVAREAGVSKATVSRVLNNRDELMTPELAERVRAAIARLGYVPSPMAQALKHGRSRLIGLVVADVANPFSIAVLRGAEQACREAGYMVMLFNLGDDESREREAIRALTSYQVDGLILHTAGRDPEVLGEAARQGKPVVLVDRRVGDAPVDLVGLDNAAAVRLALGHLLEAGYHDVMFVSQPIQGYSSREERAAAFVAGTSEAGERCRGSVFEDDGDADALAAALRRHDTGNRPALITANAVVTLRVVAAAARLNYRFGARLGLIGFDDPEWAAYVGPGISAIAQPTDDIGRSATTCLIERIDGQAAPARQLLLPGTLVARGSSQRLR